MTRYSQESANKVIEQIKKLLALASSPNENEAKLAMQRAQELMLKYNISEGALNEHERRIITVIPHMPDCYPAAFPFSMAFNKWEPYIFGTVGQIFGCWITIASRPDNRDRFTVYGFPTNIDVLLYTYSVVLQQAVQEFRAGYRKSRSITFAEGFWAGFVEGFTKRYASEVDKSQGQDVYKEVKNIFDAVPKGSYSVNIDSAMGYEHGTEVGGAVELRPGVGGTGTKGLLK